MGYQAIEVGIVVAEDDDVVALARRLGHNSADLGDGACTIVDTTTGEPPVVRDTVADALESLGYSCRRR